MKNSLIAAAIATIASAPVFAADIPVTATVVGVCEISAPDGAAVDLNVDGADAELDLTLDCNMTGKSITVSTGGVLTSEDDNTIPFNVFISAGVSDSFEVLGATETNKSSPLNRTGGTAKLSVGVPALLDSDTPAGVYTGTISVTITGAAS